GAFKSPQPGDTIDNVANSLDALFSGTSHTLEQFPLSPQFHWDGGGTKEVKWHIESPVDLPEGAWSDSDNPAVLILFQLTVLVAAGGFKTNGEEDRWFGLIRWPCRKYRVSAKLEEGLGLRFAQPDASVTLPGRPGEHAYVYDEEKIRFYSG